MVHNNFHFVLYDGGPFLNWAVGSDLAGPRPLILRTPRPWDSVLHNHLSSNHVTDRVWSFSRVWLKHAPWYACTMRLLWKEVLKKYQNKTCRCSMLFSVHTLPAFKSTITFYFPIFTSNNLQAKRFTTYRQPSCDSLLYIPIFRTRPLIFLIEQIV